MAIRVEWRQPCRDVRQDDRWKFQTLRLVHGHQPDAVAALLEDRSLGSLSNRGLLLQRLNESAKRHAAVHLVLPRQLSHVQHIGERLVTRGSENEAHVRPGVRVLVLSMHAGGEYVQRAVREGADGYLLKDSAVQDLVAGIRAVMDGRAFYSPAVQSQLARLAGDPRRREGLESLTEREREVLRLVASGKSSAEIAAELILSRRTVERHIFNIPATAPDLAPLTLFCWSQIYVPL